MRIIETLFTLNPACPRVHKAGKCKEKEASRKVWPSRWVGGQLSPINLTLLALAAGH